MLSKENVCVFMQMLTQLLHHVGSLLVLSLPLGLPAAFNIALQDTSLLPKCHMHFFFLVSSSTILLCFLHCKSVSILKSAPNFSLTCGEYVCEC